MAKNAKTKKKTSAKQPAKKQTAAKQTETKQTAAKQATTKQAATKQTAGKQTAAKQSAKAGKKADATQSKGQKALAAVKKWFRDLKAEIKKIQWTKGKDLWKNCLVVLLVVLIIGIGVWVEDALLVKIREAVYHLSLTDAETALIMAKAFFGSLSL